MADNASRMRALYDAVNNDDLAAADQFMAADLVDHELLPGYAGREGWKAWMGVLRRAFPDMRFEVEDVIAEGDRVAARATFSGTHRGELMGVAPTGRSFTVQVIDIVRFADGKAVEHWGVSDDTGMMRQLGVLPGTG